MSGGLVKLVRSAGIPRGMLTAAQGAFRYLKRPPIIKTALTHYYAQAQRFYKLAYILQDRGKNWLNSASLLLQCLMKECPNLKERLSFINKKMYSIAKIMDEVFTPVNKKFEGQLGRISLNRLQRLGEEETLKSLSQFKGQYKTTIYEIRDRISRIKNSFEEIKNKLLDRGYTEDVKVVENNLGNFERLINNRMKLKDLGITFDLEELMGEV